MICDEKSDNESINGIYCIDIAVDSYFILFELVQRHIMIWYLRGTIDKYSCLLRLSFIVLEYDYRSNSISVFSWLLFGNYTNSFQWKSDNKSIHRIYCIDIAVDFHFISFELVQRRVMRWYLWGTIDTYSSLLRLFFMVPLWLS